MHEIAYLTADQLLAMSRGGPVGCQPAGVGRGYGVNDDGSNPFGCDLSHRRINLYTGLCGYHQVLEERRRRPMIDHPIREHLRRATGSPYLS
jgi:hypothetical protein